jgi:hypothetical protein
MDIHKECVRGTRYNQSTKTYAVKSEDEVDQTISNQKMNEVDPPGQC